MALLRFYSHSLVALGVPMIVIALLYHIIRLFPVVPKYEWKIILIFLAYLASAVLFYLVVASKSEKFLQHRSMMIGVMFLLLFYLICQPYF